MVRGLPTVWGFITSKYLMYIGIITMWAYDDDRAAYCILKDTMPPRDGCILPETLVLPGLRVSPAMPKSPAVTLSTRVSARMKPLGPRVPSVNMCM